MIRSKSERSQTATKLVDCLKMNTKEELKDMAKMLYLPIPTKLRKDEYAAYFAKAVLACPDMWLPRLTHYELLLLDQLVKAEAGTYVEGPDMLIINTLELLSFILVNDDYLQKGKLRYMICDDLREAVAPYINNYLTSEKQATRLMIEQYAYGIINLYGLMSYVELLELLYEYLRDSVGKNEIADSLANSILIQRCSFEMVDEYSSNLYIQSPFLDDVDKVVEELYVYHRNITTKKKFTREEVFSAGTMPFMKVSNVYSHELQQFMMNKLGDTKEMAEYHLLVFWYIAQVEENCMSVITSMIDGKLNSMQELQEAVELFINYFNLIPRWSLKGYSSKEVSALFPKDIVKNTPPRLVAGPNMKAAGMDVIPGMQDQFDDMWQNAFSPQKVGRNDPCPCGSGKKYKKCCGRDD